MANPSILNLLQQVPLFAEMDAGLLETLASRCRRRQFRAAEMLFHKGDPGYTLYVIIAGRVAIQTVTTSGEIVHLASRGPGEYFGEMSLIDGKPRMSDVITTEPSELLMLDHADFVRCLDASPKMALSILSCLADRLRQAGEHLVGHQELDVLGRVSRTLLEWMAAHGVSEPTGGTRLAVKVTQQELADQVGASRESTNRALSSLKSVKALRMDGRTLIILSPKKLRQYGDSPT